MTDVSVIIVSYNTASDTLRAAGSVYDTVFSHSFEVIIVDNASTDGTVPLVKKRFPEAVVVARKSNAGFASANNAGAKQAKGRYLFFLNSDAFLKPGALDTLLESMERNPQAGAVSGVLSNEDGSIQPQGGALPNLLNVKAWMLFIDDVPVLSSAFLPYQQRNAGFFKKTRETGWVGGTALLIRREVFTQVGGWDGGIFMYGEDVELCIRIKKAGLKVLLIHDAEIVHAQHKSTGNSIRSIVGEIDGLLYIWKKHFPSWQMPVLKIILSFGTWLRILLFGILLGDTQKKEAYAEARRHISVAR